MAGELAIADAVLLEATKSIQTSVGASLNGVSKALQAVRRHLNMDVGFVSEFIGQSRVFRHVDTSLPSAPIHEGQKIALRDGFCLKVVNGELPQMIPDTALVPGAMAIPETTLMPIGAHMSVPIKLSDGSVYGTFCCFSNLPDQSLNERDLSVMKTVADMIAWQIEANAADIAKKASASRQIQSAIAKREPEIVYQPVFRLADGAPVGAEALARFSAEPRQPPERWFEKAGIAGLRVDLELAALENAIAGYEVCWAGNSTSRLCVNVSAATVIDCDLLTIISPAYCGRMVLEVTGHNSVVDYDRLEPALSPLRALGLKVAVDDAGLGYGSLSHVLRLRPDIIKLDLGLTRDIDKDELKRSLAAAVLDHANRIGCEIVAEGIETPAELAVLTELGIHMGQGYLLARPGSIGDVIRHRGLMG